MKTKSFFRKLSFRTTVFSFIFLGVVSSCSNNGDEILSDEEKLKLQEEELLTVEENNDSDFLLPDGEYSFIFENRTYTYTLTDGKVECDNTTKEMIDYLNSFENKLICVVNENQTMEYFTSESTYRKRYVTYEDPYRTTTLTLYRNKKYWGSRAHYNYDSRNGDTKTNTGVSWGVSSIKGRVEHVTAPLAAFFRVEFSDQANLSGRILRYELNNQELNVRNLKDVPLSPGSSENWNDRIKSLRMY